MIGNIFAGKEIFLDSKNSIISTGKTINLDEKVYHEFVQELPAPDWFRYYYFSQGKSIIANNQIKSQDYFTQLKYQPQKLQNKMNQLMHKQIKNLLTN